MTAHAQDIATVQKLLPVRIDETRSKLLSIMILDRNGEAFCRVSIGETAHSRAVMIVASINALEGELVRRDHHGL